MTDHRQEFLDSEEQHKRERIEAWDRLAGDRDRWRRRGRAYHNEIIRLLRFLIPRGQRVLEIGCATGDILAQLEPAHGLGLDFSPAMIEQARSKHPGVKFEVADAEALPVEELREQRFDVIVLSDLLGHLDDIWQVMRDVRAICHPDTKLVVTWYNFLWEPFLKLGEKIGLKMPVHDENWLTRADLQGFLALNHFDTVHSSSRTLLPLRVPLLAGFCNHLLAPLPGIRALNLIQYLVARPVPQPEPQPLTTTVVIPCRNERGNVRPALERMPKMGPEMEVVFCDGNSTDGTVEEVEAVRAERDWDFDIRVLHQEGKRGKGDAVFQAFADGRNDVLFILDADLTVPPEDLPKFYAAIAEGCGEFINGSRMVYPMERGAMRALNTIGNKFFSLALSWVLSQRIKDSLCGTKVLFKRDFDRLNADRAYFGDFDPWGDFALLFGASKLNLQIRDLSVRYRARTWGDTKMNRFRDGWILLKMTIRAYLKLRMKR